MKVNRKFLRSAERLSLSAIAKDSAAQKIVSAVTAIGFVMQPVLLQLRRYGSGQNRCD